MEWFFVCRPALTGSFVNKEYCDIAKLIVYYNYYYYIHINIQEWLINVSE